MRALLVVSLLSLSAAGQARKSDLSVVVTPACALAEVSTSVTASHQGLLSQLIGVTRFRYLLRTGNDTGGAEIRLQFSPDPSALLSFTTNVGGAGTSLSGNNIQASSPLVAATFGSNAHTARSGESGTIEWAWQGPASALPANATASALTITCR